MHRSPRIGTRTNSTSCDSRRSNDYLFILLFAVLFVGRDMTIEQEDRIREKRTKKGKGKKEAIRRISYIYVYVYVYYVLTSDVC